MVLKWFESNYRDFPWRHTSNPYQIFIAEILLRQTQAERVVNAYLNIVKLYPSPEALSQANTDELRKLFQPLGLVKRVDLLIHAAKCMINDYGGLVPNSIDELSKLPGMGIYSSRAVVCMAFGQPVPMIDESSGRLLRRVFNMMSNKPAYSDRKLLEFAKALVPVEDARNFNLGLLDIASAYCHFNRPNCGSCPLSDLCFFAKK